MVALAMGLLPQPAWATVSGKLVAWGDNFSGQTNVPAGDDFIAIVGGNSHSLALKSDGSLAGWGDNFLGQTNVPVGNDFVAVASGCCHGLALRADGSLAGWGGNNAVVDGEFVEVDFGQTDVPAGNDFVAIEAGALYSLALKSDGAIVGWGSNEFGQTNMPASNDFVAIEGGAFHSLALKSDGSLAAWGLNNYGQTNVPAGNDFVSIAAGDDHNLALKSDGSLVAWGRNNFGQRNSPSGNNYVAIAAGTAHSLALKSDGSIVGWGTNLDGAISVPTGNNFVAIDAGDYHSLAIQLLSPLSGDYNNDGSVDAADYVMWRSANSANSTQAGFKLWRTNFGAMASSGAALHSAVPEPASWTLVGIAFVAAFARQRRRAPGATTALAAAVCVAISAGLPAAAAAPTEIVSFGDSLSDVGNLYVDSGRTVPSPPYFDGRFSNGPVWVERLAEHLNLPAPAPSLSGGANYAWGGAETGSGLSFYDTPNVGTQIDSYLGSHMPTNTTLFTVWAGANDLFVHQSDPAPLVANLSGHISTLAAAGGQHFLVGNLPPLGKFPSVLGTPASPLLDALSVQFNNLLSRELDNLQSSLGVTIYRLDVYNIYQSIFADAAAYGLTNVTKPAFNDVTVVPNPDQYLFWDGDHPTRVVGKLLGDAAAALVRYLPADFNTDGSVDAADYVVWRKGLGTTYTQNDYDNWRTHFGQTAGSSRGATLGRTVVDRRARAGNTYDARDGLRHVLLSTSRSSVVISVRVARPSRSFLDPNL